MSKNIQTYNQYLLAIFGTGCILFALFFFGFIFYIEVYPKYADDDQFEGGILAEEETDLLLEDSLRKQIISFDQLELIDSASQLFLFPVTHANLVKGEQVNELSGSGLMNSFDGKDGLKYAKYYHGAVNNLVLYDGRKGQSKVIFESRISISQYWIYQKEGQHYLLIAACNKDTNNDKYLDSEDLQMLFLYNIKTAELNAMKASENYSTIDIIQSSRSTLLFGQFGLDRNNNGDYEHRKEPILIYRIDLERKALVEIVDQTQLNQLQRLLEGR
ncbi:MAG: hypothetical protein AAFP19_13070 [Bacteroidota bacterium]